MDFTSLKLDIQNWSLRNDLDDVLPTIAAYGQKKLEDLILEDGVGLSYMEGSLTYTPSLLAGTNTFTLPTDYMELQYLALTDQLPSPVITVADGGAITSGLAAGTYYYRVSALISYGETLPSLETSTTVVINHQITISWPQITGATSYEVYGRTTGAEQLIATTTAPSFSTGTGCTVSFTATNGVVTGTPTIGSGGTGYSVGNQFYINSGNKDALLTVSTVASGVVTAVTLTLGGTGYTTGGPTATIITAVVYTDTGAITPAGAMAIMNTSGKNRWAIVDRYSSKKFGDIASSYIDSTNKMRPLVYERQGNTLIFNAYADVNYAIDLRYWKRDTALSDAAPTNTWTANADRALLYTCLTELVPLLGDDTRSPVWISKRNEEIALLKSRNARERISGRRKNWTSGNLAFASGRNTWGR